MTALPSSTRNGSFYAPPEAADPDIKALHKYVEQRFDRVDKTLEGLHMHSATFENMAVGAFIALFVLEVVAILTGLTG